MSAVYDVPDQKLNDPSQDDLPTPEELFDSGELTYCDLFFDYMLEHRQQELYDLLMSQADSIVIRANIKRWSAELEKQQ